MRFRNRIHRAAIEVAQAIGGGWSNFRLAHKVVKGTVFAPDAVGNRLIELFAMCYLKPDTDRPMLDFRGDVVLAVEKLVGPLPEGDFRCYVVTTHQRRYLASADFLREHGISARHPMLLSTDERQELRALILAARWGEAQGYFEKSWTVRKDGSLEVGLRPSGRPIDANPEDVVLFQYHTSKVDDVQRLRWISILEAQRIAKSEMISYPVFDYVTSKSGSVMMRETGTAIQPFDPNDPQDRFDRSDDHPGYNGLVPLGSPTLVENQLWMRRARARMSWEIRAYELQGDNMLRVSKDKEILCNDGRIWIPEDSEGNPEQDYFADPRQVLSWKDKESGRWITIKRWNKLVMQKGYFEFKVPTDVTENGLQLYKTVRGRDISSDEAISYLHDKSVIVMRDSVFRRELEGVFLSAVENMRYARLEFFRKERGLGSPDNPVIREVTLFDGSVVKDRVPCKRCDSKWGSVSDAVKAQWVDMPHAYVCNSCGSEIWKVGVRVFVDAKYFPFVIKRDARVTHFAAEFFGHWVRELLDNGTQLKAKYKARRKTNRRRAKKHRPFDPHARALHNLRHNIINRLKRQVMQDAKVKERITKLHTEYVEAHPDIELFA